MPVTPNFGLFSFPYHTFETRYPDNSTRVQFGRSYVFTSRPDGPPQRTFVLRFETMKWFIGSVGERDTETLEFINAARLEDFYQGVEMWKSFWWEHPLEGAVLVKFATPLKIPRQIKGGNGALEPFEIEFIEQPLPYPEPRWDLVARAWDDGLVDMSSTYTTADMT